MRAQLVVQSSGFVTIYQIGRSSRGRTRHASFMARCPRADLGVRSGLTYFRKASSVAFGARIAI